MQRHSSVCPTERGQGARCGRAAALDSGPDSGSLPRDHNCRQVVSPLQVSGPLSVKVTCKVLEVITA